LSNSSSAAYHHLQQQELKSGQGRMQNVFQKSLAVKQGVPVPDNLGNSGSNFF
jgi:hypothetical protein